MSPLCVLNTLTNLNKHRYLTEISTRHSLLKLKHQRGPKTVSNFDEFTIGGGGNTVRTVPENTPLLENEIGLYISERSNPSFYDVRITFDIKFIDIEGILPQTCLFHLNAIKKDIEDIYNEFLKTCLNY